MSALLLGLGAAAAGYYLTMGKDKDKVMEPAGPSSPSEPARTEGVTSTGDVVRTEASEVGSVTMQSTGVVTGAPPSSVPAPDAPVIMTGPPVDASGRVGGCSSCGVGHGTVITTAPVADPMTTAVKGAAGSTSPPIIALPGRSPNGQPGKPVSGQSPPIVAMPGKDLAREIVYSPRGVTSVALSRKLSRVGPTVGAIY